MFISFCFCRPIFVPGTKVSCTSMLLSSISYSRYCSTASTTQHITNGSQRRIASTCPSGSDNASKQTELKSEYIVEHLYSTLRSRNERRYGNLHILKNHTTTHIAGVMLKVFALVLILVQCNTAPPLRTSQVLIVHACGVRVVLEERGLVICKSSPRTKLSTSQSTSFAFGSIIYL